MVEEFVVLLMDYYSEQFFDENYSFLQFMRRIIESNEFEEKIKVKINGFRFFFYDLRVDFGKIIKIFSNYESFLGNLELQIGGEINVLLFIYCVMFMFCGVILFYVVIFYIMF